MDRNSPTYRWILEWLDESGDADHDVRATADSVREADEAIRRMLGGETWTPEAADEIGGDETEPAYPAVIREAFDGDIAKGLLALSDAVSFRCDGGTLTVFRDR